MGKTELKLIIKQVNTSIIVDCGNYTVIVKEVRYSSVAIF